jgi:UDP-2-acetamido-2,6-beta-L-arabino-hexul-4-ose reductase
MLKAETKKQKNNPMLNIGITGQAGFMGTHLYNYLGLKKEEINLIPFADNFFENTNSLEQFVSKCDTIVHLAAMNRHGDPQVIYDTNILLVNKLIEALKKTKSKAHLLFSSSTQEERDNLYGKSKRDGRNLLIEWAKKNQSKFTGLIIPNVYGPFGNPYYNSVIATFCHQLTHNEQPRIDVDGQLKLIYIGELVEVFYKAIVSQENNFEKTVPHTSESKVSEILAILERFKADYFEKGIFPALNSRFELNLFNTFRCYFDIGAINPRFLVQNTDERGSFVETVKLEMGGQVSFSTTKPGITRGNHYHTRKIERFAVIKGEALIQLRRIGTSEILNFRLSGNQPSYVDMPIWYTHNITNTGTDELYTIFWINEFFDPNDPDTYFEKV